MDKLHNLTIEESLNGLNNGEFSSVELTQSVFERIEKVEEKVKAYISLFKDEALLLAKKADDERKAGSTKKLLGIPYSAKDLFNTKGFKTTASSKVLENYIALHESTVTAKLKEAGAILIGKTNSDAFAHGSSTENSDFFATHNPYDLTRLPGGSSGGASASVASNECIFAMGTETAGSIRQPASWCSVVGFKPTYGRVSRHGVISMCSSTDSPGPMGKTVKDCATILEIIAGQDYHDGTSSKNLVEDYSNFLLSTLSGVRIGIPQNYFNYPMETGIKEKVMESIGVLEKLGAKIVEVNLMDPKYAIAVYTIIQRAEVSSNLSRFDGIRYGNPRSSFGHEAQRRILLGTYVLSSGYYDAYYKKAQKVRTLIKKDFEDAFKHKGIDGIIMPTAPTPAFKFGEKSDNPLEMYLSDIFTIAANLVGLPAISIPAGFSKDGMPIGLQILTDASAQVGQEKLFKLAYTFEQRTEFHKRRAKIS